MLLLAKSFLFCILLIFNHIENKGKKIKVRVLDGQKRGLTTELNYLSSEPKVGDQIIISTDSRGNLSKYM